MKHSIKIVLVSMVLLAAGFFSWPYSSSAASCNANPEKFFPSSQVALVTGQLVVSTASNNLAFTEGCIYRFQSGAVYSSVRKFDSASQAADAFRINYGKYPKLSIGDMTVYIGGNLGGAAAKGSYLFIVRDYSVGYSLGQSQVESLLKYAVDQVADEPKPPTPPSPTIKPQRISMSPITVSAGVAIDMTDEGVVKYGDNVFALTLKGDDLRNILVATDNAGIKVENITLQDNRTARVYVKVSPKADDGNTKVTVTQPGKPPVTLTLRITIDGSQYLNREF